MKSVKKKWYDYLWILSLTYLILGFFNILFAWLGLLCFFILIISIASERRSTTATAGADSCLAFSAAASASPAAGTFPDG